MDRTPPLPDFAVTPLALPPAGPVTASIVRCRFDLAGAMPLGNSTTEFGVRVRCRQLRCPRCGPKIATSYLRTLHRLFHDAGEVWWTEYLYIPGWTDDPTTVRRRLNRRAGGRDEVGSAAVELVTFLTWHQDGSGRLVAFADTDLSTRKRDASSAPHSFTRATPMEALEIAHSTVVVGRTEHPNGRGAWRRALTNPLLRPGDAEYERLGEVQGRRTLNATTGRVARALKRKGDIPVFIPGGDDGLASVQARRGKVDLREVWRDEADKGWVTGDE